MIKHCILFLFVLFAIQLDGQYSDLNFEYREYPSRPKIGLALSGGSAHGLAHIGVIQYLDEIGLNVDYITGTSMGGIIGALHAMGYNGDEIADIAGRLDWDDILNNKVQYKGVSPIEKYFHDKYPLSLQIKGTSILLPQGFLNTNTLELVLEELCAPALGIDDFDQLPIPFRCFGVDIENGKIITLRSGRLDQALRATMAIPSVFSPMYYQGKWMVDGGLMRNFPVSNNLDLGADIVLGSYVGREKADMSELNNLLDILSESAFMMSIADSDKQKYMVDVLMCPDVKGTDVFDFNNYEELIKLGYESAKAQAGAFKKVLNILDKYEQADSIIPLVPVDYLYIDSIRINDIPKADKKLALDKFALLPRSHLKRSEIINGIRRISSTLNFESVTYQINQNKEKNILQINAKPREVRNLGININHFNSTNSSLILSGQIRNLLMRLSSLRANIRLSDNPAVSVDYFVRGGFNSKNWVFGLSGSVAKRENIFYSKGEQKKFGFEWIGHFKPYIMFEFNNYANIKADIDFRSYDLINKVKSFIDFSRIRNTNNRFGLEFTFDSRDTRVFANNGILFETKMGYGFLAKDDHVFTTADAENLIQFPESGDFYDFEMYFKQTIGIREKLWWSFSGDVYYKSNPSILSNYDVGGTGIKSDNHLPFVAFKDLELSFNKFVYARTDLRIGIYKNVSASLVGNIIIGDSDVLAYSAPSLDKRITAYGVGIELGMMLPIGPILFDIGYNSESDDIGTELSLGWRHIF